MQNKHGLLIAVEGIDGSGKSTLAHTLYAHLTKSYSTLLTKEPGGSPLGTQLRSILQQQKMPVCPKAEYLLFAADRAQHMHQIVLPSLQKKCIVLSDRMGDSSVVYQGYARGLEIDTITQINAWAMQGISPDITIFVDVPPHIAQQRWLARKQEVSAFEAEHESFMRNVYNGFHALYKTRKDVIIIDGTAEPEAVLLQTIASLNPWLETYATNTTTASPTVAGQP